MNPRAAVQVLAEQLLALMERDPRRPGRRARRFACACVARLRLEISDGRAVHDAQDHAASSASNTRKPVVTSSGRRSLYSGSLPLRPTQATACWRPLDEVTAGIQG